MGGIIFLVISNWFSIYPAQIVRHAFDLVEHLIKIKQLINGFTVEEQITSLVKKVLLLFGLLVLLMAFLRGVFLFFVRQTIIVMSRKIEYNQKNELFEKYQTYSQSTLLKYSTGDLMARISEDISNVRMFTGPGIMYSLNTLTLFLMILFTMIVVNVELTLYTLAPLPLLAFLIYWVHSIIIKRSEAVQAQLAILNSWVQEVFSGVRLIKAYAREEAIKDRFIASSQEFRKLSLSLVQVDALFHPLIALLIGLSTVFTVWIGGEKVIAGTLTIGTIAEFIVYLNLLVWPVAALGWVTSLIQRAAASQQRVNEVLAQEPEIIFPRTGPKLTDCSIRFENVSLYYPQTGIKALEAISFTIPQGQFLAIVGATGSGKTSLVSLLPRLWDPTEGIIYLGDYPLNAYAQLELRSAIAYVPQDSFLFSDTIRANIAFGKENATEQEIIKAAQFAGIYEDILGFPQQFETVVGERGVTLSGGQKQRISLARAYLVKKPILILDDALSAIDSQTQEYILQNLRTMCGQDGYHPTLIVVTHRLNVVQGADCIIVLQRGKIVERGKHQELLARRNFYYQLYEQQQIEAEL
ncbi:MAG: ABC transporter ATP-binding protein/permease [Bacteroidia bacterium]|nr:ABC transporter ATP-binding protein/permease [Bacteroidia bacterium]